MIRNSPSAFSSAPSPASHGPEQANYQFGRGSQTSSRWYTLPPPQWPTLSPPLTGQVFGTHGGGSTWQGHDLPEMAANVKAIACTSA